MHPDEFPAPSKGLLVTQFLTVLQGIFTDRPGKPNAQDQD